MSIGQEYSVYRCQAVVYELLETKGLEEWHAKAGEEWAEVYVFMDLKSVAGHEDMSCFRITGWIQDSGQIVVNTPLTAEAIWSTVAEDFAQLTTEDDRVFGFFFLNEDAANLTGQFIDNILARLKARIATTPINEQPLSNISIDMLLKSKKDHGSEDAAPTALLPTDCIGNQVEDGVCEEKVSTTESEEELRSSVHDEEVILHEPPTSLLARRSSSCSSYTEEDSDSDESSILEPREANTNTNTSTSTNSSTNSTALAMGQPAQVAPPKTFRSSQNVPIHACRPARNMSLSEFDEVKRLALAAISLDVEDADQGLGTYDWETNDSLLHDCEVDCECRFLKDTFGSFRIAGFVNQESMTKSGEDSISLPFKTKQQLHVTYNSRQARYEGLPMEWNELHQQFGISMNTLPKCEVQDKQGKMLRVPAILEMLKFQLLENKGHEVEGIFRIAPDKEKCQKVKEDINTGKYDGNCKDVHIFASLLKVWFRELPEQVFNVLSEKRIAEISSMKNDEAIIEAIWEIQEPNRSSALWFLDLAAEIVHYEKLNKMSSKNMAIVLSPNMHTVVTENPMIALAMSQKIAQFIEILLNARIRTCHQMH